MNITILRSSVLFAAGICLVLVVQSGCTTKRITNTSNTRDFHIRGSADYTGPGKITITVANKYNKTRPHKVVYVFEVDQKGDTLPSSAWGAGTLLSRSDAQYTPKGVGYVITSASGIASLSFSPPMEEDSSWSVGTHRLKFSLGADGKGEATTVVLIEVLPKTFINEKGEKVQVPSLAKAQGKVPIAGGEKVSDQLVDATHVDVVKVMDLTINGSSGAVLLGDTLWTHDDAPGTNRLQYYGLSKRDSGFRALKGPAQSINWEDMATDDTHVYIGDLGANTARKEHTILVARKADLRAKEPLIMARIEFTLPESTPIKEIRNTNLDCEAMVVVGDSIYLFTKNWVDSRKDKAGRTDVYRLYKKPTGKKQVAERVGAMSGVGMVTTAAYDAVKDRVVLIGSVLGDLDNHVYIVHNFKKGGREPERANSDTLRWTSPDGPKPFKAQVEAVVWENDSTLLLTSENGDPDLPFDPRLPAIWRYVLPAPGKP